MPNSIVKSFADRTGKSSREIEKVWRRAVAASPDKDNYAVVTAIMKKILKL